ncbi:GntR family transcriptional regulator [Megasphaera sueciensis]|uniref:GntR family transcriptional regulator n=1 Tax=Megasphaera sueciensis TaxID=349094 RepID=UPI003CFF7B59
MNCKENFFHFPIIRQIYHKIQNLILSATRKVGDKLPSSHMLARNFHVSKNVVIPLIWNGLFM